MAKKKKRKNRKAQPELREASVFWPLAGGVLLILFAIFVLIGGFGTGGPLPKGLFHGAYWAFGWMAYLTPIALAFFGVSKFTREDRKIPLSHLLGMATFLVSAAAIMQTIFASKDDSGAWIKYLLHYYF
jgi:hypothetical protein